MSLSCDCLAITMPGNKVEWWFDNVLHRRGAPCMGGEEVAAHLTVEVVAHLTVVEDQLAAAREEAERLRGALRGVEWVGWSAMYDDECCVECGAPKSRGHTRNCGVAAALSGGKP